MIFWKCGQMTNIAQPRKIAANEQTIGTNRDEFVLVRKMTKVDWLDTPVADELVKPVQAQGEVA